MLGPLNKVVIQGCSVLGHNWNVTELQAHLNVCNLKTPSPYHSVNDACVVLKKPHKRRNISKISHIKSNKNYINTRGTKERSSEILVM